MAAALAKGYSQLRRSACLFVTLGSAWGARSKTRGHDDFRRAAHCLEASGV